MTNLSETANEIIRNCIVGHDLTCRQWGNQLIVEDGQLRLSAQAFTEENRVRLIVHYASAWTDWRSDYLSFAWVFDNDPNDALKILIKRFVDGQFHSLLQVFAGHSCGELDVDCDRIGTPETGFDIFHGNCCFFGDNDSTRYAACADLFKSFIPIIDRFCIKQLSDGVSHSIASLVAMSNHEVTAIEVNINGQVSESLQSSFEELTWPRAEKLLMMKQLSIARCLKLPKPTERSRLIFAIWDACEIALTTSSLRQSLLAQQFEPLRVEKLEVLIPIAFAKRFCERHGVVDYEQNVFVLDQDQNQVRLPLETEPNYKLAVELAEECWYGNATLDTDRHCAMLASLSAQWDTLTQALNAGSDLDGAITRTQLLAPSAEAFGLVAEVREDRSSHAIKPKAWWKFW
jgi:hypothetical protein